MGIFGRFFRNDPRADLERAAELLATGRAFDALAAARRAEAAAEGEGAAQRRLEAREIELRAREILIGSALAEADRAEAEEEYDDAADWVEGAFEHAEHLDELTAAGRPEGGGARAADLRRRLQALRRRGREAARQPSMMRHLEDEERAGPDPLDVETHFGTLVGTLEEDVADLYLHRPLPFQQAYIDLNEGRFEPALATFDALVAEAPDDAVVRFERGRARLMTGDPAGARDDFEAAWEELGPEALDASGELSVPLLWADAAMEMGDLETMAERLEPLADPADGDPRVLVMRALALRGQGRPETLAAARELLEEGARHHPRGAIPRVLAETYLQQGERELAVSRLESIVAPACASGSCGGGQLDAEAARLLVAAYLEGIERGLDPARDARTLERAAQILGVLSVKGGGLSGREDRELVERYRRIAGTDELPFPAAVRSDPIEPAGSSGLGF